MKHTKIICTIGPASEGLDKIKQLIAAGMNMARLNFSHGSHANHAQLIKNIRAAARQAKEPLGIIQDLQGPRLRLGKLPPDGVSVKRGELITLAYENDLKKIKVTPGSIVLPTQERLQQIVKKGETILIKDGLVRLETVLVERDSLLARVEEGDVLTSGRGINLPQSDLPDVILTSKDRQDIKFGLKQKVDYFALSFTRQADDIKTLRKLLPRRGDERPKIIAKIEVKEAVKNFAGILDSTDAIMLARGDLGIELPAEDIPLIQKDFIIKCRQAGKPVIVATQMLESMMLNPRPTRAEVSDVANAVIDHTDAVMLSGETASGKYPVAACAIMKKIIIETESSRYDDVPLAENFGSDAVPDIIAYTIKQALNYTRIKAIVVVSGSGHSAQLVSGRRPEVPIIALTQSDTVRAQMALAWGLAPYIMRRHRNVDSLITAAVKLLKKELAVKKGDKIIVASGHPTGPHGELNLVKIHTV